MKRRLDRTRHSFSGTMYETQSDPSLWWGATSERLLGCRLRAQLLAALRTRFDTVAKSGDPTPIMAGDADAEIEQLLPYLTNDSGLDIEVLRTLGLVYWLRVVTTDKNATPDVRRPNAALAVRFLMPLYLHRPGGLSNPVRKWLAAVSGLPEPQPGESQAERGEALSNLAMFLLSRFVENLAGTEGRTAVALLRQAILVLPIGHASYQLVLSNLAYAILLSDVVPVLSQARYTEPPPADEVIAMFRAVLQNTPPGHQNHVRCLIGLGQALRAKALLTGHVATLDEAITTLRTASRLAGPDQLDDLGTTLRIRGLEEPQLRAMLAESDIAPAERALLQGILGRTLLAEQTGREYGPNVEKAVESLMAAVTGLPEGTEEHGLAAQLLWATTFQAMSGERNQQHRNQHADPTPDPSDSQHATSNPFLSAARLLGMDTEDSDTRHAQMTDFVQRVLNGSSDAWDVDIVAQVLLMQAKQTGHIDPAGRARAIELLLSPAAEEPVTPVPSMQDLDEIEALYERLDRELPQDDADRRLLPMEKRQMRMIRRMPSMMAPTTPTRESLDEKAAMLAEDLDALSKEIEALGEQGMMIESFMLMSSATSSPFRSITVADNAIHAHREALAARPDDLTAMTALAHSLFHRFMITPDDAYYLEGAELARRIVAMAPRLDAKLVSKWGQMARTRAWQDSIDPGGSGSDRLMRMTTADVAGLLAKSDAPGALEKLEDRRAGMLSLALNTRREVDELRRVAPDLAEEFAAWSRDQFAAGGSPGMDATPERQEQSRAHARRWDTLVNRIKALSGFDRFLRPLPLSLAELQKAAAEGPVVTINVDRRRCDALVLGDAGLLHVPLPDLQFDELVGQAEAFHAALEVVASAESPTTPANQVLVGTLAWLWDVVAEPVLTKIGYTDTPTGAWPRVWWSPTGALNFLPLHAAGKPDTPGASVIDRVVSSYTPTLRALLHSRSHAPAIERLALAVTMPQTPGQEALPATAREVAAITDRMRGPAPLVGPAATRAAVLAALPQAAVAHFACHAMADPQQPSSSHLLLSDGPLPITEISQLHLQNAELAYLSACATARGSLELADEAVHAASAFQLAGYAQVVATQWEVADTMAAALTVKFYAELAAAITNGTSLPAATALHKVTRDLRDRYRDHPAVWAAYLHAGA